MLVLHRVVSGGRLGRYVDWLLTVPLLLIELILVMQLPAEESSRKMWTLGAASGFMVAFGYPGEVRDDPAGRWFYWAVSMCPFMYVLYELYFGLAEATKKHAPSVASLIASARYITAISWSLPEGLSQCCGLGGVAVARRRPAKAGPLRASGRGRGSLRPIGVVSRVFLAGRSGRACAGRLTYPFVYMLKGIGLGGSNATAFEQVGYSFADIVAKAVFGIVIWRIAHEKTTVMEQEGLLK